MNSSCNYKASLRLCLSVLCPCPCCRKRVRLSGSSSGFKTGWQKGVTGADSPTVSFSYSWYSGKSKLVQTLSVIWLASKSKEITD